MKYNILFALLVASLCGCSTPNANPKATAAAYDQVKVGMSREQVYSLLGSPKSENPAGDLAHCQTAIWGMPHDGRGWGHCKVDFNGDTVSGVDTSYLTASGSS